VKNIIDDRPENPTARLSDDHESIRGIVNRQSTLLTSTSGNNF
jgi:hypothetical protein